MSSLRSTNIPAPLKPIRASLGAIELLAGSDPANMEYQKLLLEMHAWLSTAADRSGALELAITHRERQLQILVPFLAQTRPDADFRQKAMIAHMALARHLFERGDTTGALRHGQTAVSIGQQLVALEPSNADWMGRSASTHFSYGTILLRTGRAEQAGAAIQCRLRPCQPHPRPRPQRRRLARA